MFIRFLRLRHSPWYECTAVCLAIHQLNGLLPGQLLWTFVYCIVFEHAISLQKIPRIIWLLHFSLFKKLPNFSKVAVPFECSHTRNAGMFLTLHILANIQLSFYHGPLVRIQWYFVVVSVRISLMTNEWCWASLHVLICIYFWGKISLQIFYLIFFLLPHFKLGGLPSFYQVMSSLYILDTSPLSDIWFTNVFSQFVGCAFTSYSVFPGTMVLTCWKLFLFLLLLMFFSIILKKVLFNTEY